MNNSPTIIYSFPRYARYLLNLLKGIMITCQILLTLGLVPIAWAFFKSGYNLLSSILLTLGFGFLMWISTNSAALYITEIGLDDEAIFVKHYWKWIRIPWENVTALKPSWYSAFRPKDPDFIVFAQKLPLIYWEFGLLYAFTPHPGFMISRSMENKTQLVAKIQQKIKQNQKRVKYNKS